MRLCAVPVACLLTVLPCCLALAKPPAEAPDRDPWGIEEIDSLCDLTEGAPISDKCYGFVAGVYESILDKQLVEIEPGPHGDTRRFCPHHASIAEVIAAMRHSVKKKGVLICAGFCTSESYVAGELYADYPCHLGK